MRDSSPAQRARRRRGITSSLLVLLGVALLVSVFLLLAKLALDGGTRDLDVALLRGAQALRTELPWLADVMRDLSGMGSAVSLTLVTLGACGYLLLIGRRVTAGLLAASTGCAIATVELLKAGFGRMRPDSAFAHFTQSGLSFPSGHSSMSAVVFLTLAVLLARAHALRPERAYIMCAAFLLAGLIGLSRVALGVHWLTDVIGGWTFGAAWAIVWLLIDERLDPVEAT
jgi:undecaprenyl-diphosphatase